MPPPHSAVHNSYLKRYRETGEARVLGIGRKIGNVAAVPWPAIVEVETGTGKELVARVIHAASRSVPQPI